MMTKLDSYLYLEVNSDARARARATRPLLSTLIHVESSNALLIVLRSFGV